MITKRSTVAVAVALAALVPVAAAAATPFDGGWSVQVLSPDTECALTDDLPIRVANGAVRYDGFFGPTTTGTVASSGVLEVSIEYRRDVVLVSGTLSGETGIGSWESPTLDCEGTWVASRS